MRSWGLLVALAATAACGGGGDDDDDPRQQIDAADSDQMGGDDFDAAPPDALAIDAAPPLDAPPPDAAGKGIVVSPLALTVSESGTTAEFTITVTAQPSSAIGLTLSISDTTEIDANPLFMVFGVDSWEPVVVTVVGLPDGIADGDQTVTIEVPPATSFDPDYSELDAPDVTVTNVDID